jgi:hypothetical protein
MNFNIQKTENSSKSGAYTEILLLLVFICFLINTASVCSSGNNMSSAKMTNGFGEKEQNSHMYKFDTVISRTVLENYLERAITMQDMVTGQGNFQDNLRMIRHIGAKFLGRSICNWGGEDTLLHNLQYAEKRISEVHNTDPEIVLQACIFEIVTPKVEMVSVPDWAFKAFDMPVVKRNFRYNDMIYTDGQFVNHWGNGSVPDISRTETRLFFYFLAVSYINAGIEAIHFGQVELMNKNDKNLDHYAELLAMIRRYAVTKARRHMLLCDSHVPGGGFVKDGILLMDFHSFPLRIKEVPGKPQEAILELGFSDGLYRRSKGGITYSGWTCESLPYLVEIDNWGPSDHPGQITNKPNSIWVWGYDEITWFALQPKEYRHKWLRYAHDWVHNVDSNAHFEMPGARGLEPGVPDGLRLYMANNPGKSNPGGFGDEDVILEIWSGKHK